MHIAARAEICAGACQHHYLYVICDLQPTKKIAQFGIRFKGQWIFLLRPIERYGCNLIGHFPQQVLCLITGKGTASDCAHAEGSCNESRNLVSSTCSCCCSSSLRPLVRLSIQSLCCSAIAS